MIIVPARRARRCAKAWSARARSGSTASATISAIASDAIRSIRSKAATTAPSGAPRAGVAVASRTYARRRAAARSIARRKRVIARWLPVGADSVGSTPPAPPPASRGCHSGTSRPASVSRSASSRPIGTSTRIRSMPAAIRLAASSSAASTSGSRRVTPSHGRSASPSIPIVSRRTVRWASMRSIAAVASRWASASATQTLVALAEQFCLEREVDRARRDVHRELPRFEVVLEQRHRERQRDAVAEGTRVSLQPAIDGRARQRPAGRVQAGHPEQAQDRPLLADRRGGTRASAPRAGERIRPRHQAVERPLGGHAVHRREYGPAVRARGDAAAQGHRSTALASRTPARNPR